MSIVSFPYFGSLRMPCSLAIKQSSISKSPLNTTLLAKQRCQQDIVHSISISSLRRFNSGLRSLSQFSKDQIETMRKNYIRDSQWAEMESMDIYICRAFENSQHYVSSVELSSDEQIQFKRIKSWYQNEYLPQKSNLLPFIPLSVIGKTFEISGGDYLKDRERSFYLENGVLGPLNIRTLNSEKLQIISQKFQDFHKNHNRNLGSVYTMLKNRCLLDLATNKEILDKVSSILGKNIMLCNVTINELAPGMGKSTIETGGMVDSLNCHSDLSSGSQYHFEVGINSITNLTLDNRCVHVWVSISGTDKENAPLYFFPKTHHWEITTPFTYLDHTKNDPIALNHILKLLSFKQGSAARRIGLYNVEYQYLLSSKYNKLLSNIRRTEIYTKPGDCILFNAHTRHGSGFNASTSSRLAVTMRYNTALTEAGGQETAGSVLTMAERKSLGILDDKRKPMIQVLGKHHHKNNLPIDIQSLF